MRTLLASALACLIPISAARAQGRPSIQSAEELIAAVRAGQQTGGFTMRARFVTGTGREGEGTVIQMRAVGRRDAATSRLLYQALWPAAVKGRAAYIQKDGRQAPGGFTFAPPDTVTPLTRELLSEPFLDTAMSLEDLTEEFWNWPDPAAAGQATVQSRPCTMIDLRPPAGVASSYTRIRSCVSPDRLLPLSIEKIGRDGRVARRFVVKKAIKGENGRWAPISITVEDLERNRTTTIEVSRGQREVTISLADFSIAKIKSLGR
jgi:hypothetical protein